MPERPLIVFPEPTVASRDKLRVVPPVTHFPNRRRQGQRITPQFTTLKAYFDGRAVALTASAAGQVPEEVIVFETIGTITNFLNAARRISGLDLLAEWDVEDIEPDADFYIENKA